MFSLIVDTLCFLALGSSAEKPARRLKFYWHYRCYGWRVEFNLIPASPMACTVNVAFVPAGTENYLRRRTNSAAPNAHKTSTPGSGTAGLEKWMWSMMAAVVTAV